MAKTDHGPEPSIVACRAAPATEPGMPRRVSYVVTRRATREEEEKYEKLPAMEKEAFATCTGEIKKLNLLQ